MLEIIIYSSIIGYVYADVLMEEHRPLHWWFNLLTTKVANRINWLYYLLTCSLCMSGQFALWSFIIIGQGGIIDLIFTISGSILLTKIIQKWS